MNKAMVIIPTYNESGNIEATVTALQMAFKFVKNWSMHILVVDDSSPDGTAQIVQKLQLKQPNLHLLINAQKNGLGAAYLKGMDEAFDHLKAEVVFEFDADLSHDPSKIPLMMAKIDAGSDMVIGSRYIAGGSIPANWGWHRKFLSVVGNIVIKIILTNFSLADWTSGYRAITRRVFRQVGPEMRDERFNGYTFQVGFLHKAVKKKFKISEVPFHFKDRTVGKSKIGPEFIVNNLLYLIKVRTQDVLASRVFKFLVVGSVTAIAQLVALQIWRLLIGFQFANFLSIETAVVMNFALSNLWTFADRRLTWSEVPGKFIKFNLTSGGSILIQMLVAFLGEAFFGLKTLFILPIINFAFDTGTLYAVVGILIGMFWNFFAYNFFIWNKKQS